MRTRTILTLAAIAVELAALVLLVLFIHAATATLSSVAEFGVRAEREDGTLLVQIPVRNGGFVTVGVIALVEIREGGQVLSADRTSGSIPPGESTVLDLRLQIPEGLTEERAELNLRLVIETFHGLLGMEISGRLGGGGC